MRALVTGATGFVGGHLCEALVRQGASVTALVRSPAKAGFLAPLGLRLVPGDLYAAPALAEAVGGQHVIFHVAGLTAARNEAEFLRANRDGTAALVEAVRRAGGTPRMVLVSSLAAAGPSSPGRPLTGDEPPRPVTQYGRSKLAGEQVVRTSGLDWVIVRPPMVYGPRDSEVLKVFRLVRTGVAPIFGDGAQELSAVYGPDLALALIAAATSAGTVGRTYHACHPERFRSEAFVVAVAAAMERRTPSVIHLPRWLGRVALGFTGAAARLAGRATILTADKAHEFFQPAWTGDPAQLTRDTGWRADHDLRRGLAATAAWYRASGWL